MKFTIVASGMLMLVSSVAAQAQILKCVDKNGKIEFATSCPSGTKQQDTGVPSKPSAAPAPAKDDKGDKGADKGKPAEKSAPKSLVDRDAESRKNQKEKADADAKAEKSAAESAQRKQTCDDARSFLKGLQERQRITRTDPKTGERVFFEEQDYIRETAKAERTVAENCK